MAEILILKWEGTRKNILYDRCIYESVGDMNLSQNIYIYQKAMENRISGKNSHVFKNFQLVQKIILFLSFWLHEDFQLLLACHAYRRQPTNHWNIFVLILMIHFLSIDNNWVLQQGIRLLLFFSSYHISFYLQLFTTFIYGYKT